MKLRGTLGGLNLLIEPGDTSQRVTEILSTRLDVLKSNVTIEIQGDAEPGALEAALMAIRLAGGTPGRIRAPRVTVNAPTTTATSTITPETQALTPLNPLESSARTVIVTHNLRAGFRGEYQGSVIILGDVNPGAEVIAGGDVIVIGALRGMAHAGQGGHADAIVWARPIASPQIRIGNAVARAPEGGTLSSMRQKREAQAVAEMARLQDGQIIIDAQKN